MSKHTPGPLKILEEEIFPGAYDTGGLIAHVYGKDPENQKANATLFSNASEMLEALKNFPGFLSDQKSQDEWLAGIAQLIGKAEGK